MRFGVTCAAAALAAVLALADAAGGEGFTWRETYAGAFLGSGWGYNEFVDVEGFSNWGRRGWTVEYSDTGVVGGALLGQGLAVGGVPLRLEIDGAWANLSARTSRLDPGARDETAVSKYRWIATARAGVEQPLGPLTLFAGGGLALARIADSLTDVDFIPNRIEDPVGSVDPDDSFRADSTRVGWVVGAGVEAPLPVRPAWSLRIEGSYLDFGKRTRYVNRSGNNRCGPGGPNRACPYRVKNRLGIVRVALVYRFGAGPPADSPTGETGN